MDALVTGVCAAGGLVLGVPSEVVVTRVGARESLARPWRVGNRPRALAISLCGAALCGGLAARLGADVALAAYAVLALSLVALSAVDLERFIIPNRILYPTAAVVVPVLVVASAVDHRWGSLWRAALAAAVAFVAFLAVHLAVPHGMGFGDVRLSGLLGFATGWLGLGHAFVGFFAGFVLGAVVGIGVMAAGRGGRKTRIPFGPFLAAGAMVAVLWGNPLVHALFHRGT
jgi:leader peptidase (prepilin peptidase) / N-methyltransferase